MDDVIYNSTKYKVLVKFLYILLIAYYTHITYILVVYVVLFYICDYLYIFSVY